MPLVGSHSTGLPLVSENPRFCPSPFAPLMVLPFRHVSIQLVPFDRVLTVYGLFVGLICPCFLTLSLDTSKWDPSLRKHPSLFSLTCGTHNGPNISNRHCHVVNKISILHYFCMQKHHINKLIKTP